MRVLFVAVRWRLGRVFVILDFPLHENRDLVKDIRRFVRREPLPVYTEGVYETRFGDLEKQAKLDITEQQEIAADLRAKISDFQKREQEKAEKAKKPPEPVPTVPPPTPTPTPAPAPSMA